MSNNEKKIGNGLKKAGGAMGKLLRFLHIRPVEGGLEVTDQVLRLAYFDGTVMAVPRGADRTRRFRRREDKG